MDCAYHPTTDRVVFSASWPCPPGLGDAGRGLLAGLLAAARRAGAHVRTLMCERVSGCPCGSGLPADEDRYGYVSCDACHGTGREAHRSDVVARCGTAVRQVGPTVDYACECEERAERRTYVVTSHEGKRTICSYCAECADLAAGDWNGETASIAAYETLSARGVL